MQTSSNQHFPNAALLACPEKKAPPHFTPLEQETRPTVNTAAAANYLHLAPQTLRIWACRENGPIRPRRIHGRLHWMTADIRHLLGVSK
jgi:hypothetical protein